MTGKVITLPNKLEMWKRLLDFKLSSHMIEKFLPALLKEAGTEISARGLLIMFNCAVQEYTKDKPYMASSMYKLTFQFIDLIVDDLEVKYEAKALLEEELCKK